uniref:Uncharacterized protein LOC100369106 n=1 Tax=Saccoglossus kowalevskii TaxID=10224 RepID=A0ABM0MUX5_SACKO|nr:PREDICTED: uncharacterized protein LOC100369106 [Saccoglossus kowalevskii]
MAAWVSGSEERHYDMKFPPCPVKLKDGDTCCSISSVSLDEWAECRKRFLFLTPPNESVDTGNGSLLLDDQFRGQLFVKGTWVADWIEDNLHTGVNFCELRIDRDRNAVSQPTEIDHKLSSMWPRALEQRSDLAGRYFDLLANNPNCRDVRHANTYAMTETTAALMAEQFRKVNDDAFPVIDSFAWQELGKVQDEIQRKVVRCNQTLLNLLHKSGRYTTLEEAREAMKTKTLLVKPFARLTDDQRSILQHGIKLANLVEPKLELSMIDVIDTKDEEKPVIRDKRIELPFWMLDIEIVHKFGKMCGAEKCLCREIRICNSLITLRRDHIPQKVTKHSREPGIDQSIMKIVSHFVSPECQRTSPYCTELHAVGHVLDYSETHAHCVTVEEELRSKIKRLEIDLMDYEKNFQDELKKMRGNNAILEKQLMDSMVRNTDSDSRIKEIGEQYEKQFQDQKRRWQKSIQDKDAHIKAQEDDILELEKDLNHKNQLLDNREKQLEGYSKTLDHKHTVMVEKVTHYRDKLKEKANDVLTANRTQEYASTLCNEVASICKDICTELEAQPYICNICTIKRRSHVFLPCSHYKFCEDCAHKLFKEKKGCPICKQPIASLTKIFE